MKHQKINLRMCGICLFVFINAVNGFAGIWITNVTITPSVPVSSDTVTIDIACQTNIILDWGLMYVEHSSPSIDLINNTIGIDLWTQMDPSVDFSFDLDETVKLNPLPAGNYTLNIVLMDEYLLLADTNQTLFSVIPEPATFALLALGGLVLRYRRT